MEEPSDAPFYQDEGISPHIISPFMYDKSGLHLNIQSVAEDPKIGELKRNAAPTELHSPDLGLLKLASPELEKMIMSLQGNVTTSPTPNSLYCTSVEAHGSSTEHEVYARGFTDALQDLHDKQVSGETTQTIIDISEHSASSDPFLGHNPCNRNPPLYISSNPAPTSRPAESFIYPPPLQRSSDPSDFFTTSNSSYSTSKPSGFYQYPASSAVSGYSNLYQYPTDPGSTVQPYHDFGSENAGFRGFSSYNSTVVAPKCELGGGFNIDSQTAQFVTDSNALQPIDLEVQEIVKRERKKQRNRVASSKCRRRKLEREARLEGRVKDLKERNIELNAVANALKQQVCDLKQRVMDHVSEGCQIMLAHQAQI